MPRARHWTLRVGAGVVFTLALAFSDIRTHAEGDEVDLALVLAVDCSFSVDANEFAQQVQGLGAAFKRAEVKAAIQQGNLQRIAVSVVEWSDAKSQVVVVPWTTVSTDAEIESLGDRLTAIRRDLAEGGTSISSALLYAEALFTTAPKSQRQVVDVSSDGRNNIGVPVASARDRLVARGITINGLVILNEWPTLDVYFQNQVVGGQGHFVIPADNYTAYGEAIYRKLLKEITGPGVS
jgi:Mg-chelatase subunit ChlD